mmetsp:Transcript_838/g.3060  ORF Transcript_838/g.3060 Transcript_838/m.3060 type:complete len:241 (-) Transcript_838:504-1226(-)
MGATSPLAMLARIASSAALKSASALGANLPSTNECSAVWLMSITAGRSQSGTSAIMSTDSNSTPDAVAKRTDPRSSSASARRASARAAGKGSAPVMITAVGLPVETRAEKASIADESSMVTTGGNLCLSTNAATDSALMAPPRKSSDSGGAPTTSVTWHATSAGRSARVRESMLSASGVGSATSANLRFSCTSAITSATAVRSPSPAPASTKAAFSPKISAKKSPRSDAASTAIGFEVVR